MWFEKLREPTQSEQSSEHDGDTAGLREATDKAVRGAYVGARNIRSFHAERRLQGGWLVIIEVEGLNKVGGPVRQILSGPAWNYTKQWKVGPLTPDKYASDLDSLAR